MILSKKNDLLDRADSYINHQYKYIKGKDKDFKVEYLILGELFTFFEINVIDDALAFELDSGVLNFNNKKNLKIIFDKYIKEIFLSFNLQKQNLIIDSLINIILDKDFNFLLSNKKYYFYNEINDGVLFLGEILTLLLEYKTNGENI